MKYCLKQNTIMTIEIIRRTYDQQKIFSSKKTIYHPENDIFQGGLISKNYDPREDQNA